MSVPNDERLIKIDAQVAEARDRIITERRATERVVLMATKEAAARAELWQRLAEEQQRVKDLVLADAVNFAIYLNSKKIKTSMTLGTASFSTHEEVNGRFGIKRMQYVRHDATSMGGWSVEKTIRTEGATSYGPYGSETYHEYQVETGIALTDSGELYNYSGPKGLAKVESPVSSEQIIPLNLLNLSNNNETAQNAAIVAWHGKFVELAGALTVSQHN